MAITAARRPQNPRFGVAFNLVVATGLLAGCATGGGPRERPSNDAVDGQLAQIASFRTGKHPDAALAALDRLLKQVSQQGGAPAVAPPTRTALGGELRSGDGSARA